MYFKTEGLVLRETEYKDADKLLTVLTRDRGQLTLRARGVMSRNSKLKSGCQLLAYAEFTVFSGRASMTVDEAVPLELTASTSTTTQKLISGVRGDDVHVFKYMKYGAACPGKLFCPGRGGPFPGR